MGSYLQLLSKGVTQADVFHRIALGCCVIYVLVRAREEAENLNKKVAVILKVKLCVCLVGAI